MIVNSGNLQTLYRGFNAAFRDGFGQAMADHMPFTLDVTSMTRTEEYGWLGQFPGLKEWVGERVLRGIREHSYVIRNRKFETTVEVSRDDIEDDHYGVYAPLFQEMGRSAAAHPCELTFAQLKGGVRHGVLRRAVLLRHGPPGARRRERSRTTAAGTAPGGICSTAAG